MIEMPPISSPYIVTLLYLLLFLCPFIVQISPLVPSITKQEKWRIVLCYSVLFAVDYAALSLLFVNGDLAFYYTTYKHLLCVIWIPYLLLSIYCYRGRVYWNIFLMSVTMILMTNIHAFTYHFLLQFIEPIQYAAFYVCHLFLTLLVSALTWPWVAKYMRTLFTVGKLKASSLLWREIVPVPAMIALQNMAMTIIDLERHTTFMGTIHVTLFVIMYLFARSLQTTLKQIDLIWDTQVEKEQLEKQRMSLEDYNRLEEEAHQKLQTFLRNKQERLEKIRQYMQQGQKQEALRLIQDMGVAMNRTKVLPFCANALCNASISMYAARAREQGITFASSLDIPAEIYMDSELSVVLSNLLENALHANLEQPAQTRRISLVAVRQGDSGWVNLLISNPYDGEMVFGYEGYPRSTRSGHGLGMQSLRRFVRDNGADVFFEHENGWFTVYLHFSCGQPQT